MYEQNGQPLFTHEGFDFNGDGKMDYTYDGASFHPFEELNGLFFR